MSVGVQLDASQAAPGELLVVAGVDVLEHHGLSGGCWRRDLGHQPFAGEVVSGNDRAPAPGAGVHQHPAVGLLQLDELAPPELGTLAVGLDESLHEGPQRVGVAPLVADIHVVGPVATRSGSLDQPSRRGGREAARRARRPLHGRAHGHPTRGVEVLAHPDLLAVVQRGGAGEREEQAVDHPDAPRVTVDHGWEPTLQTPVVDLHRGLGTEGGEDLCAFPVCQLVERQLVVVADESRPLGGLMGRRA